MSVTVKRERMCKQRIFKLLVKFQMCVKCIYLEYICKGKMVILVFVILKIERSVIIPTLKADMKEKKKKNTAGFAVGIPGGCIGIPDVPVDALPLKTFFFLFFLFCLVLRYILYALVDKLECYNIFVTPRYLVITLSRFSFVSCEVIVFDDFNIRTKLMVKVRGNERIFTSDYVFVFRDSLGLARYMCVLY